MMMAFMLCGSTKEGLDNQYEVTAVLAHKLQDFTQLYSTKVATYIDTSATGRISGTLWS